MRRSAKRTLLAAIALGAGGAAVGGFGAAIGRDVWRTAKKLRLSLLILVILGAVVVLPFLGGRNLTRGYPKWEHVPFGSSILLIFAGALPILLFVQPDTPWEPEVGHLLVFLAFPVVLGMLYGASQSGSRVRRFEIEEHNQQFLEQFGFQEFDETEITHMDSDGNPLRLTEHTGDSLVFQAVGRRNRRAYILLSPEGRMLGYTGVIALTDQRQYRDPTGALIR